MRTVYLIRCLQIVLHHHIYNKSIVLKQDHHISLPSKWLFHHFEPYEKSVLSIKSCNLCRFIIREPSIVTCCDCCSVCDSTCDAFCLCSCSREWDCSCCFCVCMFPGCEVCACCGLLTTFACTSLRGTLDLEPYLCAGFNFFLNTCLHRYLLLPIKHPEAVHLCLSTMYKCS